MRLSSPPFIRWRQLPMAQTHTRAGHRRAPLTPRHARQRWRRRRRGRPRAPWWRARAALDFALTLQCEALLSLFDIRPALNSRSSELCDIWVVGAATYIVTLPYVNPDIRWPWLARSTDNEIKSRFWSPRAEFVAEARRRGPARGAGVLDELGPSRRQRRRSRTPESRVSQRTACHPGGPSRFDFPTHFPSLSMFPHTSKL